MPVPVGWLSQVLCLGGGVGIPGPKSEGGVGECTLPCDLSHDAFDAI